MESLLDLAFCYPALSNAAGTEKWSEDNAFTGVQSSLYWSSTTIASNTTYAWIVDLYAGSTGYGNKALTTNYVWPVRGGE